LVESPIREAADQAKISRQSAQSTHPAEVCSWYLQQVKIHLDGSSYIYRLAPAKRGFEAPSRNRFHGFFILPLI
jgi:hypothetical protein